MKHSRWVTFAFLIVLAGVTGCGIPHAIWSPDGAQAGYLCGAKGYVVDAQGGVVAKLGDSNGGFAWSGDSKALYFTGMETGAATTQSATQKTVLASWSGGNVTRLGEFPEEVRGVVHMSLSPDQNWLAMLVNQKQEGGKEWALWAFNIEKKSLTRVSKGCSTGFCFTGPRRLAFVPLSSEACAEDHAPGKLVEASADADGENVQITPLLQAIPDVTAWLQPLGENILFTAIPLHYPGVILKENSEQAAHTLYLWTRATGTLSVIRENVGTLFMPSPDGKRILFEKVGWVDGKKTSELAVMNADGSNPRVLASLDAYEQIPMWPTWRGNDEIVFVNPPGPQAKGEVHLEVVLYQIDAKGPMRAVRTLSGGWDEAMKPTVKLNSPMPTSAPIMSPGSSTTR